VGDSPRHDIAGANETGLFSILHAPPGLVRERHGIEADFEIGALVELLPILDELG
jgi:FMN phosphatase YigB (HAD superfamily)